MCNVYVCALFRFTKHFFFLSVGWGFILTTLLHVVIVVLVCVVVVVVVVSADAVI